MVSSQDGLNESTYFVFEKCVLYTRKLEGGKSYSYEEVFWIKDVELKIMSGDLFVAELKNCGRELKIDNIEMLEVLFALVEKHKNDEITAEMDMISYRELDKLVEYIDGTKKWRRCSIVSFD
jgi:hypothetical protein